MTAAISGAQLSEGTVTVATSGNNGVQTQSPAAGTSVNCGSNVNYTYKLSTTTATCTVPNLTNMRIGAAQSAWLGALFTGTLTNSITAANGKATIQSLTAGSNQPCSSAITLRN